MSRDDSKSAGETGNLLAFLPAGREAVVPHCASGDEGQPEMAAESSGLGCLAVIAQRHGLEISASQLMDDGVRTEAEMSVRELLECAESFGLKGDLVKGDWNLLVRSERYLPAVVRLKNGSYMVLQRVHSFVDEELGPPRVVLHDPKAGEDAPLIIDRARFESIWTGTVIFFKRSYGLRDEAQPFGVELLKALVFRERRFLYDVLICTLVLGCLALAPFIFWRLLIMKVLYYNSFSTLYALCAGMAVLILFDAAIFYMRRYFAIRLTQRVDVRLNTYAFNKILNLPIDLFERVPVSTLAHRVLQLRYVRSFLEAQLFGTVLDVTVVLFFVPVMFLFSPFGTLVALAISGVIAIWVFWNLPAFRLKTDVLHHAEGVRGHLLVQSIRGIRTVKSLVLEVRQRRRWDTYCAWVQKARLEVQHHLNIVMSVVKLLERLAVSGPLAVAAYLAMTSGDADSIGALYIFAIITRQTVQPIVSLAQSLDQWEDAREHIDAIGDIINRPDEEGRAGTGAMTPVQGHIQFSDVTFRYLGTRFPALQQVSFEVQAGTTLGIVGRSGSGKSTITRLLQRLHSVDHGSITIDGIDIGKYDLDYLRGNLGVVLQENFLFSGTIRENIAAARTSATYEEVVRAARLAGADEFIERLPRGFETYVYEGSSNLSGGQKQRIALARALLTDPRMLILDEATSALDPESEAIVNANLARIAHGRTLIVVSHRLSSLVKSDAILVLERGRVADIGGHEELLRRCEIYRHLWDQQNRHMPQAPHRPSKPASRSQSLVS